MNVIVKSNRIQKKNQFQSRYGLSGKSNKEKKVVAVLIENIPNQVRPELPEGLVEFICTLWGVEYAARCGYLKTIQGTSIAVSVPLIHSKTQTHFRNFFKNHVS
jgi:hypothetical protein